ncbi:MAG: hypothetical protein RR877_09300 [Aurantimicrobium sp.]|uniref:hypothetical protein n=1 Tax=Aurantimicrobium sp. TaxID=1930784 RepID=UPI002FC82847
MAKSLSQMNMEENVKQSEGVQVSDDDVEIAVRMAVQMLDEGGLKMMADAIDQSDDPAMVIGQILAQMIGQLAEELQNEYDIDPRIFLAKNGWLDTILDYIEHELNYPENFSDQIYQEVLEIIKAAASTPDAPNNVMAENGDESEQIPVPSQPAQPQQPGMGQAPLPGMA